MLQDTFDELTDLALQTTGQVIAPSKSYLVEARLGDLLRRMGFGSLDDLAHCLKARPNPVLSLEVAAALTSKDTRFFRDGDALLRLADDVLPARLKASNTGRLRVWCAGGATGQEAYSLAMLLADTDSPVPKSARIDIVSTDICKQVTERARAASYGHFDVQKGLSVHRLLKNFRREESGRWLLSDDIRGRVSFRQHNLLEDAAGLGKFDIILCRNVLGGMAKTIRMQVADRLAKQLAPGGLVMLGAGESLTGLTRLLEPSRDMRGGYVAAGTAEREAAA